MILSGQVELNHEFDDARLQDERYSSRIESQIGNQRIGRRNDAFFEINSTVKEFPGLEREILKEGQKTIRNVHGDFKKMLFKVEWKNVGITAAILNFETKRMPKITLNGIIKIMNQE
jgi:hypothetical protein